MFYSGSAGGCCAGVSEKTRGKGSGGGSSNVGGGGVGSDSVGGGESPPGCVQPAS